MAPVRFLCDFPRQYTSALSFFDLFPVDPDQREIALHTEIDRGNSCVPPELGIAVVGHPDVIRTRQHEHRGDDFARFHLVSRPHTHSTGGLNLEDVTWHQTLDISVVPTDC